MGFTVREPAPSDAEAFRTLWLEALQGHPEAFGASHETEARRSLDELRSLLEPSLERYWLGAFAGEGLVAMLALNHRTGEKLRHRAVLGAMFVQAEQRGKGLGRALLETCIERRRKLEGLETLVLAVSVGNERTRNLYLSAGFRPYCLEPGFLKLGERYISIEWLRLDLERSG